MTLTRVTENILDIDSIAPVLAPAVAGIITSATVNTPPGTIVFHCGSTAPSGYLKANGAAISRSTYSSLFSAIGVTFGFGDGTTTFNLPDLRGEFIRSWDDGRGIDSGRTFGSAQAQGYQSHNHGITDSGHTHGSNWHQTSVEVAGFGLSGSPSFTDRVAVTSSGGRATASQTTGITVNNNGGTETRPRNIALLACIKF